jgi:hypothetical protein
MATDRGAALLQAVLTGLILAWAGHAPAAAAQDTLRIAPGRACSACRITTRHVVALGADAGVHGPMLESQVTRDSRGRYFVAPTYTPGTIAVYGPDGRFQRAFGTEGDGPGEFRNIGSVVVGPGDSLWVVSGSGRVTVLDPDLEMARNIPVSGVDALIPLADGRAVARIGARALRHLGPGTSVGEQVALPEQDAMGSPFDNGLARLPDGRLLAPQGTRYRLDVVGADGTHDRAILRETGWFPEVTTNEEFQQHEQSGAPLGVIADVAVAGDGRLWVLTHRVYMEQMAEIQAELERTGASMPSVEMLQRFFDPVIELFDLAEGSVVATGGSAGRLYVTLMDGGHVVGLRELADGTVVMDLWALGVREGS